MSLGRKIFSSGSIMFQTMWTVLKCTYKSGDCKAAFLEFHETCHALEVFLCFRFRTFWGSGLEGIWVSLFLSLPGDSWKFKFTDTWGCPHEFMRTSRSALVVLWPMSSAKHLLLRTWLPVEIMILFMSNIIPTCPLLRFPKGNLKREGKVFCNTIWAWRPIRLDTSETHWSTSNEKDFLNSLIWTSCGK